MIFDGHFMKNIMGPFRAKKNCFMVILWQASCILLSQTLQIILYIERKMVNLVEERNLGC